MLRLTLERTVRTGRPLPVCTTIRPVSPVGCASLIGDTCPQFKHVGNHKPLRGVALPHDSATVPGGVKLGKRTTPNTQFRSSPKTPPSGRYPSQEPPARPRSLAAPTLVGYWPLSCVQIIVLRERLNAALFGKNASLVPATLTIVPPQHLIVSPSSSIARCLKIRPGLVPLVSSGSI